MSVPMKGGNLMKLPWQWLEIQIFLQCTSVTLLDQLWKEIWDLRCIGTVLKTKASSWLLNAKRVQSFWHEESWQCRRLTIVGDSPDGWKRLRWRPPILQSDDEVVSFAYPDGLQIWTAMSLNLMMSAYFICWTPRLWFIIEIWYFLISHGARAETNHLLSLQGRSERTRYSRVVFNTGCRCLTRVQTSAWWTSIGKTGNLFSWRWNLVYPGETVCSLDILPCWGSKVLRCDRWRFWTTGHRRSDGNETTMEITIMNKSMAHRNIFRFIFLSADFTSYWLSCSWERSETLAMQQFMKSGVYMLILMSFPSLFSVFIRIESQLMRWAPRQ
jgi:hypothetical protein